MNRRKFLKTLCATGAVAAVPVIASSKPEPSPELPGDEHIRQIKQSLQSKNPLLRGEMGRYNGVVFIGDSYHMQQ